MESAVLLFLASSISVMFGWQPMPDGSPKVEYLVQLEPELVATLQAGQSIPITSDIPDDIGPIGRIRIIVGTDELPRQKLVTQFKPWPQQLAGKGLSREGIVETQYTVPPVQTSGGSRYGNTAGSGSQILPPGGGTSVASNPLGRALQQGAQQARNLNAETKQILPPSEQLFGNGRQVRQAVDQAVEQTGQQLQSGIDAVGQRAREAVNQFGRSDSTQRSILGNGQGQKQGKILPPGQTESLQAGNGQITPRRQRIDQPVDQPAGKQRDQWQRGNTNIARTPTIRANPVGNANPTAQANPTSRSGDFNAPWPEVKSQPSSRYATQGQGQAGQGTAWASQQGGQGAPALTAPGNNNPAPSLGGNSQPPAFGTGSDWSGGPQFPVATTQTGTQQQTQPSWPATQTPQPEIRRGMVSQPGFQTASQQQAVRQAPLQQTMGMPALGNQPLATQPQDLGWSAQNGVANNRASLHGMNTQGDRTFPLLFSWVLMCGSVVGNAYLFWSYLDVRSKYQGVVHGTSGRRSRYDD